jgi:hypothetical protein
VLVTLAGPRVRQAERRADGGVEEREDVESGGLVVVWISVVQAFHRLDVGPLAVVITPVAEERLDAFEKAALAVRSSPGQPRGSCGPQLTEDAARCLDVARAREDGVMRQRLSPVRERKRRIDFSRAAKRLDGRVILEVVQGLHAAQEVRLGVRGAGCREIDAAEALSMNGYGSPEELR